MSEPYRSIFAPLPPALSADALAAAIAADTSAPARVPLPAAGPPPKQKPKRRAAGSPTPRRKKQRQREWTFGIGNTRPLKTEEKAALWKYAQTLLARTTKGRAYGALTPKTLAVYRSLLYDFHNARSGLCFPSYATVAKKLDCSPSTVGEAIHRLEKLGLLDWVHRMKWSKRDEHGVKRAVRTSNSYVLLSPPRPLWPGFPSKTANPLATMSQDFCSSCTAAKAPPDWLEKQEYEPLST